MKKLYRKGTVHPTPPIISDQLSFLPAAILTLTAALTPEDREVLAYLISCSSTTSSNSVDSPFVNVSGKSRNKGNSKNGSSSKVFAAGSGGEVGGDHPPLFHCNCFRCYMSYWVRWDSSPNRVLIHDIIDAFEDWLAQSNKLGGGVKNSRKERRNKRGSNNREGQPPPPKGSELSGSDIGKEELGGSESMGESSSVGDNASAEDEERGSVRRFVDFIGERIWGVWGQ